MASKHYSIRPSVRFRHVGEEGIVIRQDTAEVISLNETAALITEGFSQGLDSRAIAEQIAEHFDIDVHSAHDDVLAFASQLNSDGILEQKQS